MYKIQSSLVKGSRMYTNKKSTNPLSERKKKKTEKQGKAKE